MSQSHVGWGVTDSVGKSVVARPFGEIDLANAAQFRDHVVAELDRAGHSHLVLDLSEVTYMDSTAVRVLFDVSRRLETKRGRVALVLPSGSPLDKMFKITHVNEAAHVCETVEECLRFLDEEET